MSHDLNETLIFVKVVEQGSFIAAAKSLGLPKTTVSRKVQELETRLGARLLHRTTRRLGLTEAGSIYHEHCQRIARELEEAESAVSQLQSGPRGWLRFTVPYSIGITWIAPLLGQFHAQYPEIRLDMHMGNEKLDLIAGEADLALRVGALPDSNLVARKEELQFHRILAMRKPYHTGNSPRFTWQLGENGGELRDFPVTPLMTANDMSALNGALVCGEGLLLTGDVMAKPFVESGMVRRVLAGWTGPEVDFNAVFAGGRLVSPKVRAFVDFLVEKLNFDANYMLAQCPGAKLAQQQKAQEDAALESSGKRILEKVAASAV